MTGPSISWLASIQPYLTPFATVVGAASASFIAWRFGTIQVSISRQQAETAAKAVEIAGNKLRFELFDRRLQVFEAIREHMYDIETDSVPDLPSVYWEAVASAKWLFGSDLNQWLEECLRPIDHEVAKARAQMKASSQDDRYASDMESDYLAYLAQQFAELDSIGERYLALGR